jgi:hypothetical protein
VPSGTEPGDVAGVAQDDRRHHGTNAVDVGDGGVDGRDRGPDALLDPDDLLVETANIGQQVKCEGFAFDVDQAQAPQTAEGCSSRGLVEAAGPATGDEQAQHGVQPADRLGSQPGQLAVTVGEDA